MRKRVEESFATTKFFEVIRAKRFFKKCQTCLIQCKRQKYGIYSALKSLKISSEILRKVFEKFSF